MKGDEEVGCGRKIGLLNCCSIVTGDAAVLMKNLPDGFVSLVITDPPYGISYHSNWYLLGNPHAPIKGDDSFPVWAIAEAKRIATHAAYFFCRWNNLRNLPQPKSYIAWVKNNWSSGDLKHEHGRTWEGIAFYPLSAHCFRVRPPDVIGEGRVSPGNLRHPTEKPEGVCSFLIDANEGETILDPFCGSGTTLVAAKKLGRHFLGIEIEPKYVEIARQRLLNIKNVSTSY